MFYEITYAGFSNFRNVTLTHSGKIFMFSEILVIDFFDSSEENYYSREIG